MILRRELAYLRADLGAVSRMRDESEAAGDFIGHMQVTSRAEELAVQLREAEAEAALYLAVDVEIGFPGAGIGPEHAINLPLALDIIAMLRQLVASRMPLEPKVEVMTMSRCGMDLVFGDEACAGASSDVGLAAAVTWSVRAIAGAASAPPADAHDRALLAPLFSVLASADYGMAMSDGAASFMLSSSDVREAHSALAGIPLRPQGSP